MSKSNWKENIIDLILIFSKQYQTNELPTEQTQALVSSYSPTEISAAYAYVFETAALDSLDMEEASSDSATSTKSTPFRVFHATETQFLEKESQNLLREIVFCKILPPVRFEYFIDHILSESTRSIPPSIVKRILYEHLFSDSLNMNGLFFLKGNERIN